MSLRKRKKNIRTVMEHRRKPECPPDQPDTFYHRHLPHWQPPGATYHVTFRLDGSLPRHAVEELRQEREEMEKELAKVDNEFEKRTIRQKFHWRQFEKFESLLDGATLGPFWLRRPEVAEIVQNALHYYDHTKYDLLAHSIMPNHVHVVFIDVRRVSRPDASDEPGARELDETGVPSYVITDTLGSIKKYTARRANRILGRSGAFWQDESYDHVVQTQDELDRTINYVLNNPVKAGLVQSWEEWPWTYLKQEML